jgi:hypothetical protein
MTNICGITVVVGIEAFVDDGSPGGDLQGGMDLRA